MGSTKQHTGWLTLDNKYRSRGRGNGFFSYNNENSDGLSELNRGPRAQITKNQKVPTRFTVTTKGQNDNLPDTVEKNTLCAAPDREQYNPEEFPETFTDAKFFVIKSYSEDDVHKSVKYNVWSSTQNGNKKLDAAYQESQNTNPINARFSFLFSNLDYWQQDKWVGYFPVKWHIVKDAPNSMLKHIILEYNENKPVTRDTQEMIKIFKDHSSKRCILDDLEFYEERQKRIKEKKAKQQFQKQGSDIVTTSY
ncbi:putative YTH domain-containing protein [Helianthus debilis subsp. tardiflorus]